MASRTDGTMGTTTFGYDWAKRETSITPPSSYATGSVTRTYRLDGTLATQAFPSSVTETLADAWGQTIGTSGSTADPWRYRGLLDVSPTATPLYAMGARFYSPQLGTFTAEDAVAGSALNPLSMNRFLYAQADPETLVDPDGHYASSLNYCPPDADICRTSSGTTYVNPKPEPPSDQAPTTSSCTTGSCATAPGPTTGPQPGPPPVDCGRNPNQTYCNPEQSPDLFLRDFKSINTVGLCTQGGLNVAIVGGDATVCAIRDVAGRRAVTLTFGGGIDVGIDDRINESVLLSTGDNVRDQKDLFDYAGGSVGLAGVVATQFSWGTGTSGQTVHDVAISGGTGVAASVQLGRSWTFVDDNQADIDNARQFFLGIDPWTTVDAIWAARDALLSGLQHVQ